MMTETRPSGVHQSPRAGAQYAIEQVKVACDKCGSLLDILYDWNRLPVPRNLNYFEHRWANQRR